MQLHAGLLRVCNDLQQKFSSRSPLPFPILRSLLCISQNDFTDEVNLLQRKVGNVLAPFLPGCTLQAHPTGDIYR